MNSVAECRRFRVFRQPKLQSLRRAVLAENLRNFEWTCSQAARLAAWEKESRRGKTRRRWHPGLSDPGTYVAERRLAAFVLRLHVRTMRNERLDVFLVQRQDREEQRRLCIGIGRVYIGALAQQEFNQLFRALNAGVVQRRPADLIFGVGVRLRSQQQTADLFRS